MPPSSEPQSGPNTDPDAELLDLSAIEQMEDLPQEAPIAQKIAWRIQRAQGDQPDGAAFWQDPKLGIRTSPLSLEPEQVNAIRGVYGLLKSGHNRLYIEAPTGWGKTVAAMKLLELLKGKHGKPIRTAIVVDDTGTLRQWVDAFDNLMPEVGKTGIAAGVYVGAFYGKQKEHTKPIVVTTYNSFIDKRKSGFFKPDEFDLVILDEGHKSLSELRREMLDGTHAVQIALSATPAYSREKSLERYFACAYRCPPQKAEALGMIARHRNVVIMQPRVTLDKSVIREGGEFNERELRHRFKKAHLTQSFLKWYAEWKPSEAEAPLYGRQGIINCLSVDHAEEVAAEINEALQGKFGNGIVPAVALNGKTPHKIRSQAERDYRAGKILMLCGDELFVHGFDAPNVDFVFNMAPSTSGVKVGQRGGRARRRDRTGKNPNKIATIVDVLFNNQSPYGWQLLYDEWVSSRLVNSTDFKMQAVAATGLKPAKLPAAARGLKSVNWDNVPPDEIVSTPEGLANLIAWREQRWRELRPAPVWSSRFPKVWAAMKEHGVYAVKALYDRFPTLNSTGTRLGIVLSGITKHYNPERYEQNWHPACLLLARCLGKHVSTLFPVPEEYKGKKLTAEEEQRKQYRIQLRKRMEPLMKAAGFESIADLARFLGTTPQRINGVLSDGQGNLRRDGRWDDLALRMTGALNTTPEYLFGLPQNVRDRLATVGKTAAREGTNVSPDMTEGFTSVPPPAERQIIKEQTRKGLRGMMTRLLTPRQHRVIALTQGFEGKEHKLKDVGKQLGVSGARAQQIEHKGMKKFTRPKERKKELREKLDDLAHE